MGRPAARAIDFAMRVNQDKLLSLILIPLQIKPGLHRRA
jgi:hypothetical protein